MRASAGMILIRMSPLAMTGELRVRVAAVWNALINNMTGRVGLDYVRSGNGSGPGRTAESSLVLTILVARIIILSVVRNGKVAVVSRERARGCQGGVIGAK